MFAGCETVVLISYESYCGNAIASICKADGVQSASSAVETGTFTATSQACAVLRLCQLCTLSGRLLALRMSIMIHAWTGNLGLAAADAYSLQAQAKCPIVTSLPEIPSQA